MSVFSYKETYMFNIKIAAQGACVVLLFGCSANYSAIHRSEALDRTDRLVTQDAKQKAILRQVRSEDGTLTTCIEPSPDALSVFAATASGNLTTPQQLTAAFGGTRSESGANIGLRTQTITILRDQGYRICEAFANSGISYIDYAQLLRRNQILTTASLAIEQLTGAVVGPSAAIGASASLEVDQAAVSAAADKVAAQEKAVATQQAVVNGKVADEAKAKSASEDAAAKAKAKKDELDKLPADDPKRPAVQKEYDDLMKAEQKAATDYATAQQAIRTEQTKLEGEKRALNTLNQTLNEARNPEHKSRTASTLNGAYVVSKDIPGVANAVENIVDLAFSKSYIFDLCQMYWSGSIPKASPRLGDICERVMKSFEYTATNMANAWLEATKRTGTLPPGPPPSEPFNVFD